MSLSRDIFTRISDPTEKLRIFRDICVTPAEILAKSLEPLSETSFLKAEVLNGNELCCLVLNPQVELNPSGEIILQLSLGTEKYLCQAPYVLKENRVYIQTNVDVFHLQRREDFRLRLPSHYKAYFQLMMLNHKPHAGQMQVMDISGGGCRLKVQPKPRTFQIGDVLSGEIHLPDRPPIAISAEIRHEHNDEVHHAQVFGVQFVGISRPVKNRLAALVMDLYRELFSRLT